MLKTRILFFFLLLSSAAFGQSGSFGNAFIFEGGELTIHGVHDFQRNGLLNGGIILGQRTGEKGFMSFAPNSSHVNASNQAYLDGYVRTYQSGSFIFPIGHQGKWRPAGVSGASTTSPIDAAYFSIDPNEALAPANGLFDTESRDSFIVSVSNIEYWDINGGFETKITVSWEPSSEVESLTQGQLPNLRIVGWNGEKWVMIPSSVDNLSIFGAPSALTRGSLTSLDPLAPDSFQAYTLGVIAPQIKVSVEAIDFTFAAIDEKLAVAYAVSNRGTVTLFNVVVKDPSTGFEATVEKLEPGELLEFPHFIYTVTAEDFVIGFKDYEVEALGFTIDDFEVRDKAEDTVLKQIIQAIDVKVTASTNVISQVGQVVTYTYEVINIGNTDIGSIRIVDRTMGLDDVLFNLLYAETTTFTIDYVVTQQDIDRGSIENVVVAEIVQFFLTGENTGKADDDELVSVSQSPALTILKESVHNNFFGIGEVLSYSLTVTNTGNVTLGNIEVKDPLTGLSRVIPSLSPSSVEVITTSYTVLQRDVDSGVIVNKATASSMFDGVAYEVNDSLSIDLLQSLIISSDNFGAYQVNFGGNLGNLLENGSLNNQAIDPSLVTIEILNFGGLQGVIINDDGTIQLIAGLNPVGVYTLEYKICERSNPSNCATAVVTFELESIKVDLAVIKTSNQVSIWEGDDFEYEIRVNNIGANDATMVVIEDILPMGVRFVSQSTTSSNANLTVNFSQQGDVLRWTVTDFNSDGTIDIKLRVNADALSRNEEVTITNLVSVFSEEQDLDRSNNSDSDINKVRPFFIPNVISPDEDGKNDKFVIKGLDKFESNSIVIFNRYGDHVFEADNYKNDWYAEGLPAGTFYYVLKAVDSVGKKHVFKGWILIVNEKLKGIR